MRAGREIGKIAADKIMPVTLELGGKSPDIIFEDADFFDQIDSDLVLQGLLTALKMNI